MIDSQEKQQVCCPFNKDHVIDRNKLTFHISNCKSRDMNKFTTCQFNSSHIILKEQKNHHEQTCQDKHSNKVQNEKFERRLKRIQKERSRSRDKKKKKNKRGKLLEKKQQEKKEKQQQEDQAYLAEESNDEDLDVSDDLLELLQTMTLEEQGSPNKSMAFEKGNIGKQMKASNK